MLTAGVKNRLWYPEDRRLSTAHASVCAERIAAGLERSGDCADGLDEQALFEALHTCTYRLVRLQRLDGFDTTEQASWARRRAAIRGFLVRNNLGLVYHCLQRFRCDPLDREDLRAEGMLALIRSVDHFDPWRGVRFGTYAYNSIVRALTRLRRRNSQYHRQFSLTFDHEPERPGRDESGTALFVERLQGALQRNLGELTAREADVLRRRFPDGDAPRLTLEAIGAGCGLSKERVRQIQNRALRKLRKVLEGDPVLQ